jgi:hypothetical protein
MPPKFQSSFIPKGPAAPVAAGIIPQAKPAAQHDILAFLAKGVFALSILLAAGVVGYKWYLNYSIAKMKAELDAARSEVASGLTTDLIRLNDRITSAQALIDNHRVLSPLFAFLQASTPQTVQLTDFAYSEDDTGPHLMVHGSAKSYAALALEANVIEKDKNFIAPVFSDFLLDDKGNVTFSLKAGLSPDLLSYAKTVGRTSLPAAASSSTPVATTSPAALPSQAASSTAATAASSSGQTTTP